MKIKLFPFLLILSLLLPLLCGCGTSPESSAPADSGSSSPVQKLSLPAPEITDVISEEGTGDNGDGFSFEYSYHIPQLTRQSDVAGEINKDIQKSFGDKVNTQLQLISEKQCPEIYHIRWDSYETGSVLSLVIRADNLWGDYDYKVYNYDLNSDTLCSTDTLLARAGLTEDTFPKAVQTAAVREFDIRTAPYYDKYFDPYTLERRAYTAANCLFDSSLIYLDGNDLHVIVRLGALAGAEVVTADVKIVPDASASSDAAPLQCNQDYIWAALDADGNVTVSFENTEDSRIPMSNSFVTYQSYPAEGCYGDYQSIFMGNIGDSFSPYLFLLTKDGHVEYLDVHDGFMMCGTLCCGGPLSGVHDISGFEKETLQAGGTSLDTVYAVSSTGERYSLLEVLEEAQNSICYRYSGTGNCIHDGRVIYLEMDSGSNAMELDFGPLAGLIDQRYTGYYTALGMNDNALVYSYHLYDAQEGKAFCGCFEIPSSLTDSFSYDSDYIALRWISGDNPFGTEELLTFTRSVG